MSTPSPLAASAFDPPAQAHGESRRASWLREPLLHFIVLGGVLFAVDHVMIGGAADPSTIVVSAAVDQQASETFKASRGREPNKEELQALRRVWLDNEVLYREGLALQVDKGDVAIRERVIFKALSVVDAGIKLPQATDARLREWFERHRVKYDEPARYSFQEAVLSATNSEAAVRAFVSKLNSGTPGDAEAGLRVFKDRPLDNLVQSYGADFAKTLETSPKQQWLALQTRGGWRAIWVDSITRAKPAVFDELRGVVLHDWTDAMAAQQRSDTVRALARKYTIEIEGAAP